MARTLAWSIVAGALVALVVAAVMAGLDWRLNPGGIFRSESGTSWHRVAETMLSWFWPTWLAATGVMVPLALSVALWRGRR